MGRFRALGGKRKVSIGWQPPALRRGIFSRLLFIFVMRYSTSFSSDAVFLQYKLLADCKLHFFICITNLILHVLFQKLSLHSKLCPSVWKR